jgi:hypothetical protein
VITKRSLVLWFLGALALFLGAAALVPSLVHADPVVASQPVPGAGWPTYVALGLAALAGVRAVVDALLSFFRAEAPLTKTLVDDRFRDSLEVAHDKLDKLAGSLNGLIEATRPPGGIRVIGGAA